MRCVVCRSKLNLRSQTCTHPQKYLWFKKRLQCLRTFSITQWPVSSDASFWFNIFFTLVALICLLSRCVWCLGLCGNVAASYPALKRPLESSSTSSTSIDWKRPRGALWGRHWLAVLREMADMEAAALWVTGDVWFGCSDTVQRTQLFSKQLLCFDAVIIFN